MGNLLAAAAGTPTGEGTVNIRDTTMEKIEEIIEQEVLHNIKEPGTHSRLPASSCKEIAEQQPNIVSGNYWVQGHFGSIGVYCDFEGSRFGQVGGWMRLAIVNKSSNTESFCSPGLTFVHQPKVACTHPPQRCSSKVLPVHGVQYSTVCGRLLASQQGTTDGLGTTNADVNNLNGVYFDGVSITHGNPRKHIWSFAGTAVSNSAKCPCYSDTGRSPPSWFVGNDYFCESGTTSLWDGQGCAPNDMCCQRGGPWFCKHLPSPTRDDIELRICTTGADEKFYIEEIEMYIQ